MSRAAARAPRCSVSIMTFAPMTIAAAALAATRARRASPGSAFVAADLVLTLRRSPARHHRLADHLRPAPAGQRRDAARPVHARAQDRRGRDGRGLSSRTTRCCAARPAIKLAAPRQDRRRQPRAVRARGPAHEPADPPEHRRGVRLRPQPRRRLLLRDGVSRRRHRSRAARAQARPAAERPRRARSSRRCAARCTRRTRAASSIATSSPRTSSCASAAWSPDVAKVVDFGLVKEITADTGASRRSSSARPRTSRPRRSPIRRRSGSAVDLYALGAVGYFLLTGRRVFEGKTAVDVCIQHVTTAPTPPSQVAAIHISPELEAIIMRCLAKRPGRSLRERGRRWPTRCAQMPIRGTGTSPRRGGGGASSDSSSRRAVAGERRQTLTITVDLGKRD